jgi:protein involved in polysaccharide export with SLBB domain
VKKAKGPDYVVEPPDVLLVKYAHPDGSDTVKIDGPRLVRPDGTVGLGALGAVHVSGKTIDEARAAIARHLKGRLDGFDARKLTVEVLASNSKVFYVITKDTGGSEQVYRFPAAPGKTVLDALVEVKGLLVGLGKKRVSVRRQGGDGQGEQALPVDWRAITQDGNVATNYRLRPGDRVYVEPRSSRPPTVLPADTNVARLPVPSEAQVLRALPKGWAGGKADNLNILTERLDCRVDEPRFFPVVGPARLVHTHWKCTVVSARKTTVVYLDVDYLIPSR